MITVNSRVINSCNDINNAFLDSNRSSSCCCSSNSNHNTNYNNDIQNQNNYDNNSNSNYTNNVDKDDVKIDNKRNYINKIVDVAQIGTCN